MTTALQFANAPKKSANLSLNSKVLETAKALGMNLSKTVDGLLADEVKRRYWEKWRDDNKEAFEAYNEMVRRDGLPLAKYRTWGKSLGDGRVQKDDDGAI
jgi:antitoxin CcdA